MSEEILHVESRRAERAKNVQMLQHVIAAIFLISNGWQHLHHGGELPLLPLLEIAAGATLVVSAAREKLHRAKGGHERIAWVELAGAAMMFVEAIEKTQERHHLSFKIFSFLPAVVLLFFAIFDARISKRYLKATDDALHYRSRRLVWRTFAWSDMTAYRVEGTRFTFLRPNGGSRKLDLRDAHDREGAVAWTIAQLAAHQVPRGEAKAGQGQSDQ